MTNAPHQIEVGILFSPLIHFRLNGIYHHKGQAYSGEYSISKMDNKYRLENATASQEVELPLSFQAENFEENDFDLTDVVIGIQFHWERKEEQKFKGNLKIIDENQHLTAINILPIEEYLLSVISSEMKASSSFEFLKAHAVISRSWLLAQQEKAKRISQDYNSCRRTEQEYIRWYDREDHSHFDVCADDHCQRYQGISKAYTPRVQQAMEATTGEVLMFNQQICDARFYKCCGGVTEKFEHTWEAIVHPYLDKVVDSETDLETGDLSQEEEARKWILSSPPTFCNTTDSAILSEVLNDYDLETQHFFRWKEVYTAELLSALVKKKIDIDFGTISDIIPLERGVSGRLIRIKIIGSLRSMIIGKELVIRKAFSASHLYSSAFVVDKVLDGEGDKFVFHGAGWGHGVGLCQIGAAVMGAKGYSYKEILLHYFKGSELVKLY